MIISAPYAFSRYMICRVHIAALLVFSILSSISVYAVSAFPYKVKVLTENGKEVLITMAGDEYRKYAISQDGYSLLCDSAGWWYITRSNNGDIIKSDYKLVSSEDESEELRQFKAGCPKGLVPDVKVSPILYKAHGTRKSNTSAPIIGKRRALVILMQYKDLKFQKTRDEFIELFNAIGYKESGAKGSVRDYYKFVSQGQLNYISDIYGPYTAKNNMSYYGRNNSNGGSDTNPVELCVEAMRNLPDTVDFSVYDNDNDGLIDNVHIIFAGYGEEAGASADAIWAHEYPHRIGLKNEIGYSLAGYSCSPELRGNMGNNISYIGVICHELGHALGAMDYYDTNYRTGGEYEGTGIWDIMASGSWNDNGRTPSNFNPYVRTTIFGWNRQVVLDENKKVIIPRIEADNSGESIVYRIETGSDGDYFLLENRQLYGFDESLPGSGLMIYHIHPSIDKYQSTNTVNSTHPQCLYPVCASGSNPIIGDYGDINSANCPFPGLRNVRSFSPTSSPSAVAWNGSTANVSITNITQDSHNGSISFSTDKNSETTEPDEPEPPTENTLTYSESFESGISKMEVYSTMGKNQWRSYKAGDFVMNEEFIPTSTDGKAILMLFSGKDNSISESEIVSSEIEIEAGTNYTITYDIYSKVISTSPIPQFRLYVEDKYGEYNVHSLHEATNKWEHIEIPIVFADNIFKYKFYGVINSGGLFIDNFRLYKEEPTSIDKKKLSKTFRYKIANNSLMLESDIKHEISLTSLNGSCIYKSIITPLKSLIISNIPNGIYILNIDNEHILKIVTK